MKEGFKAYIGKPVVKFAREIVATDLIIVSVLFPQWQ